MLGAFNFRKKRPLAYERNPLAGDNKPLSSGKELPMEKFLFGIAVFIGGAMLLMLAQGLWASFQQFVEFLSS